MRILRGQGSKPAPNHQLIPLFTLSVLVQLLGASPETLCPFSFDR